MKEVREREIETNFQYSALEIYYSRQTGIRIQNLNGLNSIKVYFFSHSTVQCIAVVLSGGVAIPYNHSGSQIPSILWLCNPIGLQNLSLILHLAGWHRKSVWRIVMRFLRPTYGNLCITPVTFYWSELIYMFTPTCKGVWEI